jgi:DnaJ-class molecular chaperone
MTAGSVAAQTYRIGKPTSDAILLRRAICRFLKVKEHAFFERHQQDLHCAIPLNIAQAALGTEIEVPTLDEPYKLKIPEGTQSGAQFRIRHKGVPVVNGSAGAICT